jgi:tetratricopeptide (TPR) repeat protein
MSQPPPDAPWPPAAPAAPYPPYQGSPAQPPAAYPPYQAGLPPAPRKKSRKKAAIIAGAAAGVLVLAAGGVFGVRAVQENRRADAYAAAAALQDDGNCADAAPAFRDLGDYEDSEWRAKECDNAIAYQEAQTLFEAGDFPAAVTAFKALGNYQDAAQQARLAGQHVEFEAAQALFKSGEVAAAWSAFADLFEAGFEEAAEWMDRCDYQEAEDLLEKGERYAAWVAFTALGDFEDAADRAEDCLAPLPAAGEIWHDDSYRSSVSAIKLDLTNVAEAHYIKIYAGETLVATMFIEGGGSVTSELPAGDYTIKSATGDLWFGEVDLFGEDGVYTKLTYDDGEDWFALGANIITTITFNSADGEANMGAIEESLEEF